MLKKVCIFVLSICAAFAIVASVSAYRGFEYEQTEITLCDLEPEEVLY